MLYRARTIYSRVKSAGWLKKQYLVTSCDVFETRHIGLREADRHSMLGCLGFKTIDDLMQSTIPKPIQLVDNSHVASASSPPLTEHDALLKCDHILSKNVVHKSFIGQGYFDTLTPSVIRRNVLENPGWYTAYTPYQSEISQGRMAVLFAFQSMVCELTSMSACGASLLDEGTAAAEAMGMCRNKTTKKGRRFFVSEHLHPQTIDVLRTRADSAGIQLVVADHASVDDFDDYFGCIVQYPDTNGILHDFEGFVTAAHKQNTSVVVASDLLACARVVPPGEWGADIVVGSSQRFGVPMGFGGPHAAFLSCTDRFQRLMPGRIIGLSKDAHGAPCFRMALQTREQHIRRDKATSNICTAQVLLANIATFYGIYHGADGIKRLANGVHRTAARIAAELSRSGYTLATTDPRLFFDTVKVEKVDAKALQRACAARGLDIRVYDGETACAIAVGESCSESDVSHILEAFGVLSDRDPPAPEEKEEEGTRTSSFMRHPLFHDYTTETSIVRLMKQYERADLSLVNSMIPLGSCTMKLNAASEMIPITWPHAANMHPYTPRENSMGYAELISELHADLVALTGFAAMSSQPNSGAQGEYAGLLCIRRYHESNDDFVRNVCLIPSSAHGTNPASAVLAGYTVITVGSDTNGNIDISDLREKAELHKANLGAFMVTYPSTYGVFEEGIQAVIEIVHACGGQVYMDGANMNAQCGWTSPGFIGADVCHLNLHKTFCIPHGGGGPGVGTIGVAEHLAPFLPGHCVAPTGGEGANVAVKSAGAISSAPHGSASILPITYMYIKMMGHAGLRNATANAILSANYMAYRLGRRFDVLFTGKNGQCAHEFILDIRPFKVHGITEEDIAKRLQDYGFHAPTMSWPVSGTLMLEPTESESKEELDRYCDALLMIRDEIEEVMAGRTTAEASPLKHAPHTQFVYGAETWTASYSRRQAAFPAPWMTMCNKYWPTVSRVNNVYGDRNLVCKFVYSEEDEENTELKKTGPVVSPVRVAFK
jgi:glycine dehydrogenase